MSKSSDNLDKNLFQYFADCPRHSPNLIIQFNIKGKTVNYNVSEVIEGTEPAYGGTCYTFIVPKVNKIRIYHAGSCANMIWKATVQSETRCKLIGDYEVIIPNNFETCGIYLIEYISPSNQIFCTVELDLDAEIPTIICEEIDYEYFIKPSVLKN